MSDIVQIGDDVLRKKAQPVPRGEITAEKFQDIIKRMKEALATQPDGVALAAPQIGEPWRIFVVSHKMFMDYDEIDPDNPPLDRDRVFINPEIVNTSKKKLSMDEGCLSVRWKYGQVERHKQATVRAYDEKGEEFQLGGSGLLAQIFQHETDHLDGILFVDKAENLRDINPENSNH